MKNNTGCLGMLFKGGIFSFLFLFWLWGATAIFLTSPGPEWMKILLACSFGTLLPGIFLFTRSFFKSLTLCLVLVAALVAWWQTLQPTNNKDWSAEVAKIAHGDLQGDKLTMHNVRNFRYVADTFSDEKWETKEQWETREYNLDNIQGLDLFLSYWCSEHIAHTIMSWNFGQDNHLAISIEARRDKNQSYSIVKGFFKQFELSYIAADERDLIRLRTNYRKEPVYAYHLNVTKEQARLLLEKYVAKMNRLVNKPEFYNTLTHNCSTILKLHANVIEPGNQFPMDWRIIASGHVDEYLYGKGLLSKKLPFDTLKNKSRIDQRMQLHGEDYFSTILRYDLPKL